MKTPGFMALFISVIALLHQSAQAASWEQVTALYGTQACFDVFRKDEKVGNHRVLFSREEDGLLVDSRMTLTVRLMSIPVYQFRYKSQGLWRQNLLQRLDVIVDDDGDVKQVTARRTGQILTIEGPEGITRHEGRLYPTNHWHAGVLGSSEVLNTLNGKINRISLQPVGSAKNIRTVSESDVTHYRYSGDLRSEVWYDKAGRWIKLRFQAKDGSKIEYRSVGCGS